MRINRWLMAAALAAGLGLGADQAVAQQNGGGGGGRGGRGGNFDPAQFRQRMLDNVKENLEITDDSEWNAIKPLVEKVMDARAATMSGMGGRMFRRRGGDNAGDQGQRRGPFGQTPSAEQENLQKAVDAKAPKAEIKAALDKYQAYRKTKQAELEQAQANLRKVLTARQEAVLTLDGLL